MNGIEAELVGVVETDPVLTSQTGRPLATLGVAVTHADSDKARTVARVQVSAFGPAAERVCELATKGTRVFAKGTLKQSHKATGEIRHELELAALRIGVVGAVPPPSASGAAAGEAIPFAEEAR